jgi:hypothetical protein
MAVSGAEEPTSQRISKARFRPYYGHRPDEPDFTWNRFQANYWTTIFPAILVISAGMAGAVAPLTTAILASVDGRHTGSASGLNSAID